MKTIDNIKYFWEDLPTWSKGVVVVGGIAIFYIVGKTVYENRKEKEAEKKSLEDQVAAANEIKDLAKKGIFPTMTEVDFKQLTGAILKQFAGCDASFNSFGILHDPKNIKKAKRKDLYSNSGQLIYNFIEQAQNDADFLGMIAYFGKQTYQDCFEGLGIPPTTTNFIGAVNKELDQKEIVALNTLLTSKGITKRFY